MKQQSFRSKLVTRRTYSRPLTEDLFETWPQTIDRVIGHQYRLWDDAQIAPLSSDQLDELDRLNEILLAREGSLSGRTNWLGGTGVAYRRASSQFNCSHTLAETVHDIVDIFWLLLQGCGVGSRAVAGTLNGLAKPAEIVVIRSERTIEDWEAGKRGVEDNKVFRELNAKGQRVYHLKVGDSAEAWAKSVGKLLALKEPVDVIVLDFSEVRAAGIRLKGYGWISSGDRAIADALTAICRILSNSAGRLLTKMQIHDIINWLGTTLSSRRSAEIMTMFFDDPEWSEFATWKKDYWLTGQTQREQSNNTTLFWQRPSKLELRAIFGMMMEAGGSEPAFANAAHALRRAPWFKGFNPCLSGDTLVSTHQGLRRIEELAGDSSYIWDGEGLLVPARFEQTSASAEVVRVCLSDGSEVVCTPNHNWVREDGSFIPASDLAPGDRLKVANIEGRFGQTHSPDEAYLDAWLIADDTRYNDHTGRAALDKSRVPSYVLGGSQETVQRFIEGYTQSAGHIGHTGQGWLVQYTSVHRSFLQDLQAMLRLFGVHSRISLECDSGYRLTVANPSKFFVYFAPENNKHGPHKIDFKVEVESVELLVDRIPVYCAGVPTTNSFDLAGVHTGNCAEILLGNKSFCNLVEVNLEAFNGRFDDLLQAVYLLARANYRQTCVNLDDGILQRTWHELNQFLRLTGVGLTGYVSWEGQGDAEALRKIADTAIRGVNSMADELGLPRSQLTTTIKPSGTLSKVMDTTEGCHKPLGKYIFNNINLGIHDPAVPLLRAANYRVSEHPTSPDSVLVTLPVAYENVEFEVVDGVEVNLESAVDQLERYKFLMENYVQHNCSITVSYSPEEVPEVIDWIYDNWESYVGVSFIYRNDPTKTAADLGYPYLPQEVVTKEQYDEYVNSLLFVDLDATGVVDGLLDDECATGACPVR